MPRADPIAISVIGVLFSEVIPAAGGKERRVECPYCSHRRRKFYINATSGLYHCKHCGAKGNLFTLCRDMGTSLREVLSKVGIHIRPAPEGWAADARGRLFGRAGAEVVQLPKEFVPLSSRRGVTGRQVAAWLEGRGIGPEAAERYGIGYCATGDYRGRIVVPIFDSSELVYFVARLFTAGARKYMNPEIDKAGVVFGTDAIREVAIICEGVFDAMAVGPGGVAVLGLDMSLSQVLRIFVAGASTAIVLLDSAAEVEAERLANQLGGVIDEVKVARLPSGDPASVGREVLVESIAGAEAFSAFSAVRSRLVRTCL